MSITTEKLSNGLTVAFEPISGMATTSLSFAIPAGTAGDPEGTAGEGESTLLSELIVRGSGTRDSRAFSGRLTHWVANAAPPSTRIMF